MNPLPAETLDPRIRRFAKEATAEMSCKHAAEVLGPPYGERTVSRLCLNGVIECTAPINAHGGVNANGTGLKMRKTISKAALLAFIIRSTQGPREAVMLAIEQELPGWKSYAQFVAAGGEAAAAPLPDNVIPIKGRAKPTRSATPHDPRQMDLFTQQSA